MTDSTTSNLLPSGKPWILSSKVIGSLWYTSSSKIFSVGIFGISSIVLALIRSFTITGIVMILLEPFLNVTFTFASKLPTSYL